LITNVNRPSERIFIGNVRKNKIGLITTLIIPKTTATITAVSKLLICTPGRIFAVIKTAIVLRRRLMRIDISPV